MTCTVCLCLHIFHILVEVCVMGMGWICSTELLHLSHATVSNSLNSIAYLSFLHPPNQWLRYSRVRKAPIPQWLETLGGTYIVLVYTLCKDKASTKLVFGQCHIHTYIVSMRSPTIYVTVFRCSGDCLRRGFEAGGWSSESLRPCWDLPQWQVGQHLQWQLGHCG